jgi:hypothetical protein
MCENLHEMHPARAKVSRGAGGPVVALRQNASDNMAGCVMKPGNHTVKCLGYAGITKCCKYSGSGSGNITAGINKISNCTMCSRTLFLA